MSATQQALAVGRVARGCRGVELGELQPVSITCRLTVREHPLQVDGVVLWPVVVSISGLAHVGLCERRSGPAGSHTVGLSLSVLAKQILRVDHR